MESAAIWNCIYNVLEIAVIGFTFSTSRWCGDDDDDNNDCAYVGGGGTHSCQTHPNAQF